MEFYLFVLLKLLIGFFILIVYLNISGKTQMSKITPIDFIGNFLFGGIIGGVIYSTSIPIYEYIIVLLIAITMIYCFNLLSEKISIIKSIAIGHPIPIIKNGKFIIENFKNKNHKIDISFITLQLRTKGIYSFDNVMYAQIEPTGELTVISDDKDLPSLLLVKDGNLMIHELKDVLEKDEEWLMNIAKKQGVTSLEEVFIAEYFRKKIKFILKNGDIK